MTMTKIKQTSNILLLSYLSGLADGMRQSGRYGTAKNYMSTLRSFRRFASEWKGFGKLNPDPGIDIPISWLTAEAIAAYESWLRARGVSLNTSSFYMRVLRATYHRAVEEGAVVSGSDPFRRVYTGVERTCKRAISLRYVKIMKSLDLSGEPRLEFARDVFMLSFYLRGMSFIDLCYLKKSDLQDGVVTYRRRKTGHKLCIGWTAEMQAVARKYQSISSPYLLPIITNHTANPRDVRRNANNAARRINRALNAIGAMLGLPSGLTTYVARHSWASAAQSKGIPTSLISEGMGHESETTTRIYLASLETPAALDRANAMILRSLK